MKKLPVLLLCTFMVFSFAACGGTGGLAGTIQDITADLPDSGILEPIGVYRPEVDGSKPAVDAWLDILGFKEGGYF